MNNYRVEGNKLITDNFETSFEKNIDQVIFHDGIYVVLLLSSNMAESITENVFGVNTNGDIIWQIENDKNTFPEKIRDAYPAFRIYVGIHLRDRDIYLQTPTPFLMWSKDENSFRAASFAGPTRFVDYKTGKIIGKGPAVK